MVQNVTSAYKGRLIEFRKKTTITIRKIIRDFSSLWDNKKGNTQVMCIFWGEIRDKRYQNSAKKIRDASSQPNHNIPYTSKCVYSVDIQLKVVFYYKESIL